MKPQWQKCIHLILYFSYPLSGLSIYYAIRWWQHRGGVHVGVPQPRGPQSPARTEAHVKNGGVRWNYGRLFPNFISFYSSTEPLGGAERTEPRAKSNTPTFICKGARCENCEFTSILTWTCTWGFFIWLVNIGLPISKSLTSDLYNGFLFTSCVNSKVNVLPEDPHRGAVACSTQI